jgi:hypothetical protein
MSRLQAGRQPGGELKHNSPQDTLVSASMPKPCHLPRPCHLYASHAQPQLACRGGAAAPSRRAAGVQAAGAAGRGAALHLRAAACGGGRRDPEAALPAPVRTAAEGKPNDSNDTRAYNLFAWICTVRFSIIMAAGMMLSVGLRGSHAGGRGHPR